MKRLSKILGVAMLAISTLTVGALGLSGCGERWKNPDTEPDPVDPPIIILPPEQERPIIGLVTLEEIKDYMNSKSVTSTFDAVKMVSNVPLDGEEGVSGIEFYAKVDKETSSINIMLKTQYGEDGFVNKYIANGEKAIYVESVGADETKKTKLVDGEGFDHQFETMLQTGTNMTNAISYFDGVCESWKQIADFKYTATRTILGGDASFKIDCTYNAVEQAETENGMTELKVAYTGSLEFVYKAGVVQSYNSELTRLEAGATRGETATVKTERVEDIPFPTDLDTYPQIESLSKEELQSFLSSEGITTTFGEIKLVEESEDNGIENLPREFIALKTDGIFKCSYKESNVFKDCIRYYSSETGKIFVDDGESKYYITDETSVNDWIKRFNDKYDIYNDIKNFVDNFLNVSDYLKDKSIFSEIEKVTLGDTIKIVFTYNYDLSDSLRYDEIVIHFVDCAVSKIENKSTWKYKDGRLQISKSTVTKHEGFVLPEGPVEGGEVVE